MLCIEPQIRYNRKYFNGSARRAEREMGWGRKTVEKGLGEVKTGFKCLDNYKGRGNKRAEEKIHGLKEAIIILAEPQTRADPAMKTSLTYTRITAKSMRKALIQDKGTSPVKPQSAEFWIVWDTI